VTSGDGSATAMAGCSGANALHPSKKESSTSGRTSSANGGSAASFAAGGRKPAGAPAGAGSTAPGAAAAMVSAELLDIAFGTLASTGFAVRRCLRRLLRVPLRGARSECCFCFLARLDMVLKSPGQGRFEVPLVSLSPYRPRSGASGTNSLA
jgi:hypothetical protein